TYSEHFGKGIWSLRDCADDRECRRPLWHSLRTLLEIIRPVSRARQLGQDSSALDNHRPSLIGGRTSRPRTCGNTTADQFCSNHSGSKCEPGAVWVSSAPVCVLFLFSAVLAKLCHGHRDWLRDFRVGGTERSGSFCRDRSGYSQCAVHF